MKTNPYDSLPAVPTFVLSSTDVKSGEAFALEHRSSPTGTGVSPQLAWRGAPAGTKSYAITMFDPDAPTPSGFWHWAVFDVPASVNELAKNAPLPDGATGLPNDARITGYLGAAPPKGHGPHRYFIVVHALDVETLPVPEEGTPAYLSFTMLGHTLARATLIATAETI